MNNRQVAAKFYYARNRGLRLDAAIG